MTAMSWNSSTEKLAWPPRLLRRPRSASVDSTIAVDDIDISMPTASAGFHDRPATMATPPTRTVVATTWAPPRPKIGRRISQSRLGRSSRPTRNSIITTPSSAKCMTWWPSVPTRPRTKGPMATPASR
jgi:hypothetical protein